jgi:hypothetical protein
VAYITQPNEFRFDIDWSSADGVTTPEIAATWCQLSIWVGARCVTLIDSEDASFRRSLHTTAYPLAEWVVYNWWQLTSDVRPSAIPLSSWAWENVYGNPWLRAHNLRAAGGGMTWPDLTIVPEGNATRLAWKSGPGLLNPSLRFLGGGDAYLPAQAVVIGLSRFVDSVLDRLDDAELDTPLAKEWEAVRASDEDEAAFNRAAARLGLDPYTVTNDIAEQIDELSEKLSPGLREEFFDSADPYRLKVAFQWWKGAKARAHQTTVDSAVLTEHFRDLFELDLPPELPFQRGYRRAKLAREALGLAVANRVDMNALVTKETLTKPAAGLEGLACFLPADTLALILPIAELPAEAMRFAQARALGLAMTGHRREYILDPASTDLMQESRAFAAEFLAPAEGIAKYLAEAHAVTDQAFSWIAGRFEAGSLLIRYQYENQLTRPFQ